MVGIWGHPQLLPNRANSVLICLKKLPLEPNVSDDAVQRHCQHHCGLDSEAANIAGVYLERLVINTEAHVVPKESLTPYFMVHFS